MTADVGSQPGAEMQAEPLNDIEAEAAANLPTDAATGDDIVAAAPAATPAEAPSRSPMRRSRSFDSRPTLTPDQRRRQARIVRLAMDTLGSADAIKGFLNDRHEGLGGRPLDLALASDEGLAAAEALIRPASGARD